MSILSENLKKLRTEKNKSQKELAASLNMSQVSYGRYELGTRIPKPEILKILAKYFDVTIDYLLGNTTARDYDSERLDKSIEKSKSFDGSPINEEDKEIIHNLIKDYLEGKGN